MISKYFRNMFWFNQHNWISNWSKDLIVDTAKTYSSARNVNLFSINVNCKDKLRLEFYNKMSLYCLISPKSHTLSADHQDSFETKHSLGDFVFFGNLGSFYRRSVPHQWSWQMTVPIFREKNRKKRSGFADVCGLCRSSFIRPTKTCDMTQSVQGLGILWHAGMTGKPENLS